MNPQLKEKMQKAALEYAENMSPLSRQQSNDIHLFMQGASAMYAELAPLVEWVSVEDRLPHYGELVLVKSITKGKYVEIFYARFNKNITHWRKIEL